MTAIFKMQFYILNHFRQVVLLKTQFNWQLVCTRTTVTIHRNAIAFHTVYGLQRFQTEIKLYMSSQIKYAF